ncbi:hypothetical protein AAMO2058_000051900 [Amorphochlora amoebiformis]
MDAFGIAALADLLREEEIDEEDDPKSLDNVRKLYGPGKEKKEGYEKPFKAVVKGNEAKGANDIWDEDEIPQGEVVPDDNDEDNRDRPEYDILYKQSVNAEDVYLNMGFKDPSSISCDTLVVKIKLPGEPLSKIDINLTESVAHVRSPKYKLYLDLPRKVDDKNGKAEFDNKTSVLKLSLPILYRSMREALEEDY